MKLSAGILVYKKSDGGLHVLLAHPGGPFWAKKDNGAWSFIKGEYEGDEDSLNAAKREFKEETGLDAPEGKYTDVGEAEITRGKKAHLWAVEADFDPAKFESNTFEMEWPPHSGQKQEFPENDRAAWFTLAEARQKLFKGQIIFLDRLAEKLNVEIEEPVQKQTSLF